MGERGGEDRGRPPYFGPLFKTLISRRKIYHSPPPLPYFFKCLGPTCLNCSLTKETRINYGHYIPIYEFDITTLSSLGPLMGGPICPLLLSLDFPCRFKTIPMSPVEFEKGNVTNFYVFLSILKGPMLPVEFKKRLHRPVKFKRQGPFPNYCLNCACYVVLHMD